MCFTPWRWRESNPQTHLRRGSRIPIPPPHANNYIQEPYNHRNTRYTTCIFMKPAYFSLSLIALIAVNLIPLIGTTYANWNIFSVMLMYWLETAIIGWFTVKRMRFLALKANENPKDPFSFNVFLLPFFCLHFGIFMFVHLIFVFAFFFSSQISWPGVIFMFASLYFSHWLSYSQNFIEHMEYKSVTQDSLFWRPYPRVIVMHLTVIFGGALTMSLNQPKAGLMVLIVFKTIIDAISHVAEHWQLSKRRV